MMANGAGVLVENLASGAPADRLAASERAVGFPLPVDLRDLWSLHAGQRGEQNGFVGAMDLFGPEEAAGEDESVKMFLGFLREDPSNWAEAGVSQEEVESDLWLAIAGRGYADLLVVSGLSDRVFTCEKDSPPLHFVAASIAEWLEGYADRVEAGAYAVEEGFGDCYLARDDAMH